MKINSQKLTKKSFRKFGDIISIENDTQFEIINKGFTKKYELSQYKSNEKELNNDISISVFRGIKRPMPLVINMLECHPLASQSFMPLNGGQWIIIVCDGSNDKPTLENLQCFVANKNQGVNYYPRTWHHPLITLEKTQDFIVVDRQSTKDENLLEFYFEDVAVKI